MDRYFAICSAQDAEFIEAWRWLIGPTATLFRVTLFGGVLLQDPATGAIDFLDAIEGAVERLAASEAELDEVLQDPEAQDVVLMTSLVDRELALGKRPGPGECLVFKVDPVLGGGFESSNIEVGFIAVHLDLLGQIHQKAANLPPGAPLGPFRTVDEPPPPAPRGGLP